MTSQPKNLNKTVFLREFSWLGASTVLFQGSRVGTELFVAKLLGPETWGIWYFLNLVIAYRSFFHFGVINGLNREAPILNGKGDHHLAFEMQNSVLTFLIISSIVLGSIFGLGYYLIEPELFSSYIAPVVLLLLCSQLFDYISVLCTTNLAFKTLGKIKIIYALCAPVIVLPLVLSLGLLGLVLGMLVAYALVVTIFFINGKRWRPFDFQWGFIAQLTRIGFPIMLVGVAYTILLTIDRFLIGIFLGVREVGVYSLTIIVFGVIVLLPRIVNQQFYPRMAMAYGKNASFETLAEMIKTQRRYTMRLLLLLIAAINLIFPIGVPLFLPEYQEGLPALFIVSVSGLSVSLASGWATYLHLINKQTIYLTLILIALVINLLVSSLLLHFGLQLIGVAIGTTISFVAFNFAIMYLGRSYSVRQAVG
ncbi:MAG: oligosaccharide flippase family protein [Cyclobacteriaceae bacterium]